ncbi:diaminohydroxyphosphoribosylaminopyrimidine deaminase [marine bacterium AO1-C]|nr:diaminohydroxyphosphoribosylaminopyrimidine deaminase [marine bacterium AO1-C]
MTIDTSKPILVTGASGYIASWIIKKLLEKGCTVRGTVRDKSNKDRYQHLVDIAGQASGTFEPIQADLMNAGDFDEAAQGCEVIMHTASPFIRSGIKDAEKQLIAPALQGTRNVLEAANKAESVKKVVLTSSVVAIYGDAADLKQTKNGVFTEEYWNETSSPGHQPYAYSKTVAEKEAWKIAEAQDRWKLAVINPSFVLGPSLTNRRDSTSIATMLDFLNGTFKQGVPKVDFGVVDVRNIADAHIEAAFRAQAEGRHIMVGAHSSLKGIAQKIEEAFPKKYKLPKSTINKLMSYLVGPMFGLSWKYVSRNVGKPLKFDNSKSLNNLGIEYIPFKQTVQEHVAQLENDGLVKS